VSTPYRNESDALRERKETLEREIARLREQTATLEGLRTREQEIEQEIASIAAKLGSSGRRALPLLDQVKVASPCSAKWDEMLGDEKVRFCLSCEKNVYNLSVMPREEAERLLEERARAELCVRFYRRADGTMMTADCPVGVTRKRRKKIALAVAGAGAMALAASTAYLRSACRTVQGEMSPMMGAVAVETAAPSATEEPRATMGEIASPPQTSQNPQPPPPPVAPVMGRRHR
jgi:hypothetical protein